LQANRAKNGTVAAKVAKEEGYEQISNIPDSVREQQRRGSQILEANGR
jgi:hypothetical protein